MQHILILTCGHSKRHGAGVCSQCCQHSSHLVLSTCYQGEKERDFTDWNHKPTLGTASAERKFLCGIFQTRTCKSILIQAGSHALQQRSALRMHKGFLNGSQCRNNSVINWKAYSSTSFSSSSTSLVTQPEMPDLGKQLIERTSKSSMGPHQSIIRHRYAASRADDWRVTGDLSKDQVIKTIQAARIKTKNARGYMC